MYSDDLEFSQGSCPFFLLRSADCWGKSEIIKYVYSVNLKLNLFLPFLVLQQLSAKREAFFKMDPPAPKFDPSARSGLTSDRERERPHIREREPIDHDRYMEKNHRDNHKELEGYVGFANLPNQVYRKSVKRGFEFTLMVVGELLELVNELTKFGELSDAVSKPDFTHADVTHFCASQWLT